MTTKLIKQVAFIASLAFLQSSSALAGDFNKIYTTAVEGLKPIGNTDPLFAAGVRANLDVNMLNTSSIQNNGSINGSSVPFLLPFNQSNGNWGTYVQNNCAYGTTGTAENPCSKGPGAGAQAQSQQQQALWDAVTAEYNARNFADGLGSSLGYAYQNVAVFQSSENNNKDASQWRGLTSGYGALDILMNYTYSVMDVAADNTKDCLGGSLRGAAATECAGLVQNAQQNIYGKTYLPEGETGGNTRGNPRPLVTRPFQSDSQVNRLTYFNSTDYYGLRISSQSWLGPVPCPNGGSNCVDGFSNPETPVGGTQVKPDNSPNGQTIAQLRGSASYPSGHSIDGYAFTTLLAIVYPERYQQLATRGAEYAFSRVVLGAHYATDTIGSRTAAYFNMAQLIGNNSDYMNLETPTQPDSKINNFLNNKTYQLTGNTSGVISAQNGDAVGPVIAKIQDFRALVTMAREQTTPILAHQCGSSVEACAATDTGRFNNLSRDGALYEAALSMGLPVVYSDRVNTTVNFKNLGVSATEDQLAAAAGYLLWTRFPYLTQDQRNDVLSTTVTSGGGFLDDGKSAYSAYSRINLFKAAAGYGAFNSLTGDVSIRMDASLGGFNARDTWSNDISGDKGFSLNGNGVMNFTGNSTYTGMTTVNGGALIIDGSVVSHVEVNAGGLLGGHGSFGGGTINGVLAPGNSIGTITSNGDLTFASGSTYAVEVNAAGASDKTNVNGRTTIQGGAVVVSNSTPSSPSALVSTKYTILTATNGVSGRFSSLTGLPTFSFLSPTLSYGANDISLGFALTPFSTVAKNLNQRSVGNALTLAALGPINPLGAPILNALFLGSYQNAQAVMDTVSGSGLAGVQSTAMQVGEMASSSISDQIAFWRSGETQDATGITSQEGSTPRGYMAYAPVEGSVASQSPIQVKDGGKLTAAVSPRTFRAWGSMFGGGANYLSDIGRGSAASALGYYGGLIGVDYQIQPNLLVGVAVGGSTANFGVGSLSTSGNLTGFHAGVYGAYNVGNSYLALNETFSTYNNQTSRKAGGYALLPYEQLNAGFGSTEFRTRLEVGHSLLMGGLKATPFVAAEYAAYQSSAFKEQNSLTPFSTFALGNNGQAINSLPTFIGLRLSNGYTLANGWRLAPTGSVAYVHEFFPQRQFTNILLSMPGADFNVSGPRSTYNLVQTKLGAQLNLTHQLALFTDFQGEFTSVSQSYGGKAGARFTW